MRRLTQAPVRSLVFHDESSDCGDTLRLTHSNMGEPYRRTVRISFESGAFGDWSRYEHTSAELNLRDIVHLRDWLNEQFPKEPDHGR